LQAKFVTNLRKLKRAMSHRTVLSHKRIMRTIYWKSA